MNHEDTRRISREELYEQVWSQPMSKLAKNYELSDVGLAKICKKLEIPIPKRGYWQRKQHGKKVSRPPLPQVNGPSEAVIRINKRENLPVDQKQATEAESRIAFEQLNENRIQVKSTLSSPHPEALTRTERQPKPKEPSWLYDKYDYNPSGRLTLLIKSYLRSVARKTWSDGKQQRIEECLNAFVVGLIKASVEMKAEELESERRHRERLEEERRRMDEERRRREEEERFQSLSTQASNWNKSQDMRAYLNAVKQFAIVEHGEILPGSRLDRWLTWAYEQANRIDPIIQGRNSILDANK